MKGLQILDWATLAVNIVMLVLNALNFRRNRETYRLLRAEQPSAMPDETVEAAAADEPYGLATRLSESSHKPFDITDSRNRYLSCPQCGATLGMGLVTQRGGGLAVWCSACEYTGPVIPNDPPGAACDKAAFDAWNAVPRCPHDRLDEDGICRGCGEDCRRGT